MRTVATFVLLFVLLSGLGVSYLVYRQLDTDTVLLQAPPQLEQSETGALCGNAAFAVSARTLGLWMLSVEKGQMVSGVVTVAGEEDADIGLKVYSPSNKLVLYEPDRKHQLTFELPPGIRGDYRFEFDNRHSAFAGKDIAVEVCFA